MELDIKGTITETANFQPRAWKLMVKRKPFVVVAIDEPYYMTVYGMIREQEKKTGRWTGEDELAFGQAFDEWKLDQFMTINRYADPEAEKAWLDFWGPILLHPDGSIDLFQLKKELCDYREMMLEVSKVYDSISMGKFSKPNTNAEYVIDAVELRIQEGIREAIAELRNEDLEEQINQAFTSLENAKENLWETEKALNAGGLESYQIRNLSDVLQKLQRAEERERLKIERLGMIIEARKAGRHE